MMNRYFLPSRFLVAVATAAFVATLPSEVTAQERTENALRKLNESVDALIKKVSPSVVQILVTGYGPVESAEHSTTALTLGRQRAIAPVSSSILPVHHHQRACCRWSAARSACGARGDDCRRFIAGHPLSSHNIVPAHVVGVAKDIDLALLKADNVNLPALSLAPYRNVRQGEFVLAFGSPEGLRNTVTLGVVSSLPGRRIPILRWSISKRTRPLTREILADL